VVAVEATTDAASWPAEGSEVSASVILEESLNCFVCELSVTGLVCCEIWPYDALAADTMSPGRMPNKVWNERPRTTFDVIFSICLAVWQFLFADEFAYEVRRLKIVEEIQLDEATSFGAIYQSGSFFICATINL
jgi:hypothetical protein